MMIIFQNATSVKTCNYIVITTRTAVPPNCNNHRTRSIENNNCNIVTNSWDTCRKPARWWLTKEDRPRERKKN